jgi:hypothetical protein
MLHTCYLEVALPKQSNSKGMDASNGTLHHIVASMHI